MDYKVFRNLFFLKFSYWNVYAEMTLCCHDRSLDASINILIVAYVTVMRALYRHPDLNYGNPRGIIHFKPFDNVHV